MAKLNVSPTRMELMRLKKRLVTARSGHKLMKDKRDELMKQFLTLVRKNEQLRREIEGELAAVQRQFLLAGSLLSDESLDAALAYPSLNVSTEVGFNNMTGVSVPVFSYSVTSGTDDIRSYGYSDTSGVLDSAVEAMNRLTPRLLELASLEKSARLLSCEIEKTRRRVNALEYIMIPQLEETIRYITMKMDENDRSTTIRLIKVKDMVLEKK